MVGSQIDGDGYSGYKKAGIFAGAWVSYTFGECSAFFMEVTYFQKGSRKNPNYDKGDYDAYLFRTNYVEVPFLYQYKIKRFILEAGPSVGVSAGYYEEFNGDVLSDYPGYDRPARLSFQGNAGARYLINRYLSFSMRFNYSLINIRSDKNYDDGQSIGPRGQFSNTLVAAVYYSFGTAKK